jgi:uncharacterized protein YqjF (DUF2071 family)
MRRTLWLVNAPMGPRGLKVTTTFHDFAIVTFAVEPERLAPLLPRGFDAEVFTLDDGSRRSFVSAVSLRNVAFGVKTLPRPWFTFAQINYRAYVRYRGERAVWFFGTMLGSPLAVAIPRYIWRLPWHAAEITLVARWRGELCETYALDARSHWGTATLRCTGTTEPMGRLDGFAGVDETRLVLTHPLRGYSRRRDGRIATYAVGHDRLAMTRANPQEARFSVFDDLDLRPGARPHLVLLMRSTRFIVELPPKTLD